MKKVRQALASISLMVFLLGCGEYAPPDHVLNANPTLPPVEPLFIEEGKGTSDIYLHKTKAVAEAYLGKSIGTINSDYVYQKEEITYEIKYGGSFNEIEKIEIKGNRFHCLNGGISFHSPKSQIEAIFGTARESFDTWYFDSYGIGFVYDQELQCALSVKIYSAIDPSISYKIDSTWIYEGLDFDGDGYYRSYKIGTNISMTSVSGFYQDSVYIQSFKKKSSDSKWPYYFDSYGNAYLSTTRGISDKAITFHGSSHNLVDIKIELFNSKDNLVATKIICGIQEESSSED